MDSSPDVAVELIGAVALVLVAMIGALGEVIRRNAREARGAADAARHAIGRPNGQGNVVEMLERILSGQAGQDGRIARLEGKQHELRQDVDRLTGRVDVIERRGVQ